MNLLIFLLLFPAVVAVILLFARGEQVRNFVVKSACLLISAACVFLLVTTFHRDTSTYSFNAPWFDKVMFFTELGLAVYIFYLGLKFKKYIVSLLILLQTAIVAGFELIFGHSIAAKNNLLVDKFSLIMALIIGVIGSLICFYAVAYMKDFHNYYHKEIKNKVGGFFFVMFLFLSAMFGIVFSNNLLWIYFFWEITTICSFLLIGYKETKESMDNAFRALAMNLLGGIAFAAGIAYLYSTSRVIELDKLINLGKGYALIPVVLIAFAGMTKSAQMPFSSWLLGAMVAPTPVSALLHSSTMVKAGVYIIIRLAPVLQGTAAGLMVALVGGLTFVSGSAIAISQSDAKKVLAYSTIANLGLIVMCAGIGTYEAVWAAILLIIFHAIAKCLLFLCVGVIEHRINSRNIEDMSGLIVMVPKTTVLMLIGMAGMFLAPFGMLISKWAVLRALIDANPVLAAFVVFGSAMTLFFWVKWMGKIITVIDTWTNLESEVKKEEWLTLTSLAFLTVGVCAFFPVLSSNLIEPYVIDVYGKAISMSQGNIIIMAIMLALLMLFPLNFLRLGKGVKFVEPYLGGANARTNTEFYGAMGKIRGFDMRNYYLEGYFGEKKLFKASMVTAAIFMVIMFCVA